MQQARIFLKGERVYHNITGDTGPCVYPALHLYIYSLIYYVTDSGNDIWNGQVIFSILYIATQLAAIATYRAAHIPPILLPLLIISKRLHSVYILRLFNDCWAMFFLYCGVWLMCKGRWRAGSILYSLALGVKMNIMLYAPAMAAIYFRALGLRESVVEASVVVGTQMLIGLPFLRQDAASYLSSAFNLNRAFLYEWTVNLRFVDEGLFLDRRLATSLLIIHATVCLLWLTHRWTGVSKTGLRWIQNNAASPGSREKGRQPSGRFIATALYTCNLIGITFSRSLHYQFYSWYAQQIPLLVYLSTLPNLLKIAIPICIESAWNTFPSTAESSLLLLGCHLALLFGLWQAAEDTEDTDEQSTHTNLTSIR